MERRWSIRELYLYLVCLITLVILIFASVDVVRNAVELIYPEPGWVAAPVLEPEVPEAEREALQRQQQEMQLRWSQRRAVLNLVRSGALLAVAGPLYIYHWRKIERE